MTDGVFYSGNSLAELPTGRQAEGLFPRTMYAKAMTMKDQTEENDFMTIKKEK